MNRALRYSFASILAATLGIGCSADESPTGPSLAAPTPQSPVGGETVEENPPTLTVANVTTMATTVTYRFEVATDENFANVIAMAEAVPQGSAGSTSWRPEARLEGGTIGDDGLAVYYWRARATADGETGPFSGAASFKIEEGFFRTEPAAGNLLVFDPLTNGMSVGEVSGGTFNTKGWMCTAADTFIRYEVPTLTQGFVEFDVTNLKEFNPVSDKRMLMIMWDPTAGDYTTNPYRMHLQKMDARTVDRWHVRLRWISQGQERNIGFDFTQWDPNRVYHWRVEWGSFPDVESQRVRVLFDGMEVLVRNYDPVYNPSTHWIELGAAPRNESLEQAIFSNVRIGRR